MGVFALLLLLLGVGIAVGLKSGKLTAFEFVTCGTFGLLLGTTAVGAWVQSVLLTLGNSLLPTVNGWLS